MADKKQVKKSLRQLQRVKTWQLLVLLILMGFISATFLRLNNINMIQRRDAVLAADSTGDTNAMTDRLYDLQRYVVAHPNASTGAFYLEGQYKRDAQKVVDAAKNDDNPNGNINAIAESICKPRYTVWSPSYVQCFTDELSKFPPSPDPIQNVTLPKAELYRYSFAAPIWAPDFAGWSLLVSGVIILMILTRLISLGILHILLKQRYKGI